jgi:hypothetical protein
MDMTTKTKNTRKPTAAQTAANNDKIVASVALGTGDNHLVKSAGGKELVIPTARWSGEIRTASLRGASFSAFEALWSKSNTAKLARGVDARSAPQSAKAVADGAAKQKAVAPKGAAVKAAKQRTEAKKADKKAEAAKRGVNRTYKVIAKLADIGAREGTKRHTMLNCILSNKTTDAAKQCCAKGGHEAEATAFITWAAKQNYIQFAD